MPGGRKPALVFPVPAQVHETVSQVDYDCTLVTHRLSSVPLPFVCLLPGRLLPVTCCLPACYLLLLRLTMTCLLFGQLLTVTRESLAHYLIIVSQLPDAVLPLAAHYVPAICLVLMPLFCRGCQPLHCCQCSRHELQSPLQCEAGLCYCSLTVGSSKSCTCPKPCSLIGLFTMRAEPRLAAGQTMSCTRTNHCLAVGPALGLSCNLSYAAPPLL